MSLPARIAAATFAALLTAPAAGQPAPALAAGTEIPGKVDSPSYADLVDLADSAELVLRAQVRKLVRLDKAREPDMPPGWGRFYIQAKTSALLTGQAAVGQSLAYLADLPLTAGGKPPALKKAEVILFAHAVPGRPGELSLVAADAQLAWNEALEARLRSILTALASPAAPPRITGVREVIYVPGNLAGEGETQIFLNTANDSASSITVRHQPGQPPAWGVSFSELVADVNHPPQPETLEWYRLACALPNVPPHSADISESATGRAQARADYRMVLGELGPCGRTRR